MNTSKVRKNVANLSIRELNAFRDAVFTLKEQGNYDKYVTMHGFVSNLGHSGPAFLPWHRFFLLKFEQELQEINPNVTLPYWDFSSRNVSNNVSKIWKDDFLGKNGHVTLQWKQKVGAEGIREADKTTKTWVVKRDNFNLNGIPVLQTRINSSLDLNSFRDFSPNLERGPHGMAHVFLGTDRGNDQSSFATAVNDPFFFLLHCNVDRLWAEWQHEKKSNWQNSNAGIPFTDEELAQDYSWLGTNRNNTWPTPPNRHNVDSILWPWDGSRAITNNEATSFLPWRNAPEHLTPRKCLNYQALDYSYDTIPEDLTDTPILGVYENHLYDNKGKNNWHFVTLSEIDENRVRWQNRAGVSWTLTKTADRTKLNIGQDCPYFRSGHSQATVIWNGNQVSGILGPWNELYNFESSNVNV